MTCSAPGPPAIAFVDGSGPFADAECTQRIAAGPGEPSVVPPCFKPLDPSRFAIYEQADGEAIRAYEVGAVQSPRPTTVHRLENGTCNAYPADTSSVYYAVGPKLAELAVLQERLESANAASQSPACVDEGSGWRPVWSMPHGPAQPLEDWRCDLAARPQSTDNGVVLGICDVGFAHGRVAHLRPPI